jgi:hypothetical protein
MAVRRKILLIFFTLSQLVAFAQDNILRRKIDYQANNQRLESALLGIANVGDFSFSYNPSIIPGDSLVELNIANSTVKQVLDVLFSGTITYKVSGNHLILLKEKPSKIHRDEQFSISGIVYNASTGDRLVSTTIYEVYTLSSTITDEEGYYKLEINQKFDEIGLAFSKQNFEDTLIMVQPANQKIDVGLVQKWSQEALVNRKPNIQSSVQSLNNISIVQKFVPKDQLVRAQNVDVIESRPAQISIIPKIGTNAKMSGSIENAISLNVLVGYSAGVGMMEIGGLMNINKRHVNGFQAAGLSNIVGGKTKGVQIAGLSNNNRSSLAGLQAAGISNMVADTIHGVQLAGISNILQGGMKGLQLAGISNVTTKNVDGLQVSGISNFARGDVLLIQAAGIINMSRNVKGVQLAGIINAASNEVGGAQLAGIGNFAQEVKAGQLAGIMNIATRKVGGAQIATILNYGKEIKGSQIGFLNVSDTVTGIPIGFLSFVLKGYRRLELSANEVLYTNLTLKTGVSKFYNIFTGGLVPGSTLDTWGFGYGIGTEGKMGKKFLHSYDLTSSWISEKEKPFGTFNLLTNLRINFGYLLGKRTSLYLGPSLNMHASTWKDTDSGAFLTQIAPYTLLQEVYGDTQFQFWVGGQAGIRF